MPLTSGDDAGGKDMDNGRAELWLPLLRSLTEQVPDWAVWKNADSALYGIGDVDAAAPRRSWPAIIRLTRSWARQQGIGPVVLCRHIPRTLNLLTVAPDGASLLQLELKAGATFRGSVQFHAADVIALSELDPRGFRRLRPGAEGVLKLLNNGMKRGAVQDRQGLAAKDVVALLRSDPEGVAAMGSRFGPARSALLDGVAAVLDGDWDRRALLQVEGWALAKSLAQPHVLAERVWFRAYRKRTCPVLHVVYRADRRIQGDVDAWLAEARRTHAVAD